MMDCCRLTRICPVGAGQANRAFPKLSKDRHCLCDEALVTHFDELESTACPCGSSHCAFAVPENEIATIHLVDISIDAKMHHHKKLTEIYLILEGKAHMELDGELTPVRPNTTILIPPGVRHHAMAR